MNVPVTEAIILAGGLGTRLRAAVPDLPKCMAPVAGHPFLHYIITHLQRQGINRFIFSLGYLGHIVEGYVRTNHPTLQAVFVTEDSPLGTGGAIQLASKSADSNPVLVVNGDTLFSIDVPELAAWHHLHTADCTIALKPMTNVDRYGAVQLDDTGRVVHFAEKQWYDEALVNGGVYLLNTASFLQEELQAPFSFETDYLANKHSQRNIFGRIEDAYFIDIGIPEDYERAGKELRVSYEL